MRFMLKRRVEVGDVLLAAAAVAFDAGLAAVTLESVAKWGGSSLAAVQQVEPNEARLVAQVFTQITRAEFADTTRVSPASRYVRPSSFVSLIVLPLRHPMRLGARCMPHFMRSLPVVRLDGWSCSHVISRLVAEVSKREVRGLP